MLRRRHASSQDEPRGASNDAPKPCPAMEKDWRRLSGYRTQRQPVAQAAGSARWNVAARRARTQAANGPDTTRRERDDDAAKEPNDLHTEPSIKQRTNLSRQHTDTQSITKRTILRCETSRIRLRNGPHGTAKRHETPISSTAPHPVWHPKRHHGRQEDGDTRASHCRGIGSGKEPPGRNTGRKRFLSFCKKKVFLIPINNITFAFSFYFTRKDNKNA